MKANCHAHPYLIMPVINHNERVTVSLNTTINISFKSHRSVEKPNGLLTWYQFFSPGSPIHFFFHLEPQHLRRWALVFTLCKAFFLKKKKRGLELVFLPHVLHDFRSKNVLTLYCTTDQINWLVACTSWFHCLIAWVPIKCLFQVK